MKAKVNNPREIKIENTELTNDEKCKVAFEITLETFCEYAESKGIDFEQFKQICLTDKEFQIKFAENMKKALTENQNPKKPRPPELILNK